MPFHFYSDRFDKLGINLFKCRKLEFDLLLMFKVCHSLSDLQLNKSTFFLYRTTPHNLCCHGFTVQSLLEPKYKDYRNFFSIALLMFGIVSPQLYPLNSASLTELNGV